MHFFSNFIALCVYDNENFKIKELRLKMTSRYELKWKKKKVDFVNHVKMYAYQFFEFKGIVGLDLR